MKQEEDATGYYPHYDSRLYREGNPHERMDEAEKLHQRNTAYIAKTKHRLMIVMVALYFGCAAALGEGADPVVWLVILISLHVSSWHYGWYCQLEESDPYRYVHELMAWENKGQPTSH